MPDPTQLNYLLPALGPGANNYNNLEGDPLSVFQPGGQEITGTAISTVFNGLLGSCIMHETTLEEFTSELNSCLFLIQVYDNSQFVGFGAIRRIEEDDIIGINLGSSYGAFPYGNGSYPGKSVPLPLIFGEVAYIYVVPEYQSTSIGVLIFAYLVQEFVKYIGKNEAGTPLRESKLLVIIPKAIPNEPTYNFCNYIQNGYFNNQSGNQQLISEFDFTNQSYHGIACPSQIYMYDGTIRSGN